jgi:hypothetical protein
VLCHSIVVNSKSATWSQDTYRKQLSTVIGFLSQQHQHLRSLPCLLSTMIKSLFNCRSYREWEVDSPKSSRERSFLDLARKCIICCAAHKLEVDGIIRLDTK